MVTHRYVPWAVLVAALVLTHSLGTAGAEEPVWPQFRGPNGLGIAPDNRTYPVKLDLSKNLLWKTEIPPGHSSPCVGGSNLHNGSVRRGPGDHLYEPRQRHNQVEASC